jgi:hypothetical protein
VCKKDESGVFYEKWAARRVLYSKKRRHALAAALFGHALL